MGDTHQGNTADPSLNRWYKNPVYVVGGCVACVIFALAVAFAIHSLMLKRAHQMAERAWVRIQGATIVGPLIQHNVPRATIFFLPLQNLTQRVDSYLYANLLLQTHRH